MPHIWQIVNRIDKAAITVVCLQRADLASAFQVPCGVFCFTNAAKFTLRLAWPLPRITSAELIYQPYEFQQICHAEKRPMPPNDDLRVRSNKIRPLRRNRADGRIIHVQQETSPIAVVPLAYASELLAAEWMERVRDAHKTCGCDRTTCIPD